MMNERLLAAQERYYGGWDSDRDIQRFMRRRVRIHCAPFLRATERNRIVAGRAVVAYSSERQVSGSAAPTLSVMITHLSAASPFFVTIAQISPLAGVFVISDL